MRRITQAELQKVLDLEEEVSKNSSAVITEFYSCGLKPNPAVVHSLAKYREALLGLVEN